MGGQVTPVLIERALLLNREQRLPDTGRIERVVAFQRSGHRVLLVATRPAGWRPTRLSVDRDLALQQQLHQMFSRAGAELDGVLYLGGGLFSRKQRQKNEFERTAHRYGRNVVDITLIGTDQALMEAARQAGIKLQVVADPGAAPGLDDLDTALKSVKW